MIHDVLKMGDPRLLRVAKPVKNVSDPAIQELIADLFDTMNHLSGAGLAAPQIGVDLRVVIFGFPARNERYPDAPPFPETVLVNPVLTALSQETEDDWEGCLSVPGLRGLVPRYKKLRYEGLDQNGNTIDRSVDGFHARVVQHECDHLDGILYPTRIRDLRKFGFLEALTAGQFNDDSPGTNR